MGERLEQGKSGDIPYEQSTTFASRNSMKYLRLRSPTQLLIHAQWWSNLAMHLLSTTPLCNRNISNL